MKRLIVSAPASITFDQLNQDQVLGLEAVMANYVQPMPGTKEYNSEVVIDCVMKDNFDPQAITDLGLPFTIMGYWDWTGAGDVDTLVPLSSEFISFLPDRVTYDEDGAVIETLPPIFHIPHSWAGWAPITI